MRVASLKKLNLGVPNLLFFSKKKQEFIKNMLLGRIGLFSSFSEQSAIEVNEFFDRKYFYEFFGSGGPLE